MKELLCACASAAVCFSNASRPSGSLVGLLKSFLWRFQLKATIFWFRSVCHHLNFQNSRGRMKNGPISLFWSLYSSGPCSYWLMVRSVPKRDETVSVSYPWALVIDFNFIFCHIIFLKNVTFIFYNSYILPNTMIPNKNRRKRVQLHN